MRTLLFLLAALVASPALAQHDHHHAHTPPEAEGAGAPSGLTADEMADLLAGRGMGLARPAELNSYPGPLHALELADSLALTDIQRERVEMARAQVVSQATALGAQVVEAERHLDALFASGEASVDDVSAAVMHIAALRGELRVTHLVAHLALREILSPEQVHAYDRLRGYTDG